jgi:peptidoglycan/LPS O-acetylase OafA/YrhL
VIPDPIGRQTSARSGSGIDPGLSVFLDLVRFGAALTVFIGHAAGQWLTGGYLWQIGAWQRAAVIVFFVLSGYVIQATTNPAAGPVKYSTDRLSRLYSVTLPALALTFILDWLGRTLFPVFYLQTAVEVTQGNYNPHEYLFLRYLLSGLFIQELWLFDWLPARSPGTNQPFWSLSYEAVYYVAFAIIVFASGWKRILGLFLIFLVAGPNILALWPIWLLGAWLWRTRGSTAARRFGVWLFLLGLVSLMSYPLWRTTLSALDATIASSYAPYVGSDYFIALAAGCLVFGFSGFSGRFERAVAPVARPVRQIADHTFELYLLHVPLVYFAAAMSPFPVGSIARFFFVYLVTALGVVLVARTTTGLRRKIASGLGAVLGAPALTERKAG